MPDLDNLERLRVDLAPFADLGTPMPEILEAKSETAIHFVRHGEVTRIQRKGGAILEFVGAADATKYSSTRSLFASDRYGNLRVWAKQQEVLLVSEEANQTELIEVKGFLDAGVTECPSSAVDDLLADAQPEGTTKVLLIDGPAGIGKTRFISELALNRARNYSNSRRSLVLHVESRGRQLSYIYDLIAYSLQRLRSDITFDQVPILCKHGLIVIAIDGFDELADPNGYNLAWAQVNELVETIRGEGQVILAGRETFIGRDRVLNDIRVLRNGVDPVHSFTLTPPTPARARDWLENNGLNQDQLQHLDDLLERGSLALRPFFLKEIAHPDVARILGQTEAGGILNLLIQAMVEREATKFGDAIDSKLDAAALKEFIVRFMRETARDMADNQTSAVSETTLSWLVEFVAPAGLDQATEFTLKNRAPYIGFLTVDSRPRHYRFYHEKFFEYFISLAIIDSIISGEVAKFVTRNIFGTSFLETFGLVLSAGFSDSKVEEFFRKLKVLLERRGGYDRSRKNLGAFALSVSNLYDSEMTFAISDFEIDEARIVGSSGKYELKQGVISQLDVRDADLSNLSTDSVSIVTLVANENSLFPENYVVPQRLSIVTGAGERVLHAQEEISSWLAQHSVNPPVKDTRLLPARFYDHPAVRLLDRATRMRQYWMRSADDRFAKRILEDDQWRRVETILERNNLLKVEYRQASGPDSRFIRIKYAEDILNEDTSNPLVKAFYADLKNDLIEEERDV